MNKELTQKFDEIYSSQILPHVRILEEYRIKERNRFYTFIALPFFFFLGLILSVSNLNIRFGFIFLIIFGVLFIKNILYIIEIPDNTRKKLKKELLNPILKIFGDFNIADEEIITIEEINSLGLFPKISTKTDDDIIKGTYKDLPVYLVETALAIAESDVYSFNGLIIKIKVNKNFNCRVVVNQKLNIKNIVNLGNDTLTINTPNIAKLNKEISNLEKISLEDTEFNKEFTIYSDNQVEARYLLTTSFMERIKNIKLKFMVSGVDFAFKDGYLYLFLGNMTTQKTKKQSESSGTRLYEFYNGLFEVGDINTSLLNKELFLKIYEELDAIFSIVDCFKLDEKTGL